MTIFYDNVSTFQSDYPQYFIQMITSTTRQFKTVQKCISYVNSCIVILILKNPSKFIIVSVSTNKNCRKYFCSNFLSNYTQRQRKKNEMFFKNTRISIFFYFFDFYLFTFATFFECRVFLNEIILCYIFEQRNLLPR